MKPISVLVPPKVLEKRVRKKPRPKNTSITRADGAARQRRINAQRQFLHDVANQLTIIALASFDLRNNENPSWNNGQLQALAAIEIAIQEAADLIGKLSGTFAEGNQLESTVNRKGQPNQKPGKNNIYPISPYLQQR